jgi:hypothetical protein
MDYSARERLGLWALAVFGLLGVNGVFLWALVLRPELVEAATANPVSAAFVLEALMLAGALGWLLGRRGLSRLHWAWFIALSLFGSIAFARPVALLVCPGSVPGAPSRRR